MFAQKRAAPKRLWGTALVWLVLWAAPAATEPFCLSGTGAASPAWEELVLEARKFTATLNARIRMDTVPVAGMSKLLPESPPGAAIQPSGSRIIRLMLNMTIEAPLRPDVRIVNEVWLDPSTAAVLGRIRLRRGQDDFKKIYRFARQGVFRHRREPSNKEELLLNPQQWTAVKDSFYAYDLPRLGCSGVSDRLALIYILSKIAWDENSRPVSLCVFGRRQLHRVTLHPRGLTTLKVDYLQATVSGEVRKQGSAKALTVAVESQPLKSNLKQDEDFSLMGLHRQIIIHLDPALRIPLQISGSTPAAGRMDLRLREVQLAPAVSQKSQ